MEVRAPGTLALSDGRGTETFALEAAQYDGALAQLGRPEFFEALEDVDDCYAIDDAVHRIVVTLKDGTRFVDERVASCLEAAAHPYGELFGELIELKRQYFPCPAGPTDSSTRMLCRYP